MTDRDFTKFENVVMKSTGVSPPCKVLYGILKSHRNEKTGACFPSVELLAEETRLSVRQVHGLRVQLKEAGLITWDRHGRAAAKYSFPLVNGAPEEKKKLTERHLPKYKKNLTLICNGLQVEDSPICNGLQVEDSLTCNPAYLQPAISGIKPGSVSILKELDLSNKTNTPSFGNDVPSTDVDVQFANFWKTYPKKTHKAEAERAWKKIKNPATLQLILKALVWQTQSKGWTEIKYIPNPASYLNGQRWLDEKPNAVKEEEEEDAAEERRRQAMMETERKEMEHRELVERERRMKGGSK